MIALGVHACGLDNLEMLRHCSRKSTYTCTPVRYHSQWHVGQTSQQCLSYMGASCYIRLGITFQYLAPDCHAMLCCIA